MAYVDQLEEARLAIVLLLRDKPLAAQRIAYHPHEARYLQRLGMWNASRMFVVDPHPFAVSRFRLQPTRGA